MSRNSLLEVGAISETYELSRLRTKWLRVRISLLSLQIWRLLRTRSSLTFRQTIECGLTLKFVRDMITTDSLPDCGFHDMDM